MSPDISVIISAFNRLWSLPEAVESCRGSTCRTEIVVVDDGSTDGTWDWLQRQKDVVAIRQDNWGQDWALTRGRSAASGEYVRFLDSDDWLLPGSNDRQLAIARGENADVVVAGYRFCDELQGVDEDRPWVDCDDFVAQPLGECDSSHYSAYLFRNDFIKDIPNRQDFAFREDRMFVIEVALANPRVAVHTDPTFVHRHHGNARIQFPKGMLSVVTNWQHLQVYRKSLTMLESRGELTPRRIKAAINVLWPLAHRIAYTNLREACEVADWVYRMDSSFVPPENGLLGFIYRRLGFRRTEQLLSVRRRLLDTVR